MCNPSRLHSHVPSTANKCVQPWPPWKRFKKESKIIVFLSLTWVFDLVFKYMPAEMQKQTKQWEKIKLVRWFLFLSPKTKTGHQKRGPRKDGRSWKHQQATLSSSDSNTWIHLLEVSGVQIHFWCCSTGYWGNRNPRRLYITTRFSCIWKKMEVFLPLRKSFSASKEVDLETASLDLKTCLATPQLCVIKIVSLHLCVSCLKNRDRSSIYFN